MASSEFSLIDTWFATFSQQRNDVVLGIGDDCAVLSCPAGYDLAVSIDTLVQGVHFFADVDPEALGHKSLAVSLSDLAAMGATPAWFTLALTLPERDDIWLEKFVRGLSQLAQQHHIQLVGGDTTRGPLSISIQVHGFVEHNHAVYRSGAKVGDQIFVSGTLGDAGAALKQRLENWQPVGFSEADTAYLQQRLERPIPANRLSVALKRYATAAIDISDGLLADLGHILQRSHVGARLELAKLPLSPVLQKLPEQEAVELALMSGDDYELCFTVPIEHVTNLLSSVEGIQHIGEITDSGRCELITATGEVKAAPDRKGYDHFDDKKSQL